MASDRTTMPKVNLGENFGNMSDTEKHYMQKIQDMNVERATKMKRLRFRNRVLGGALGLFVIGVYTYTLSAVKQEKFLDFDEVPNDSQKTT